jgi:hypothetical protein
MSVRSLDRQVKRELRRESFPLNSDPAWTRISVASLWSTVGAGVIAIIWGGTFWCVLGTMGIVFVASVHYSYNMALAMAYA